MKKIFDVEFREELINGMIEAGISEKTAVDMVSQKYKTAIKEAIIDHFDNIVNLLEKDEYDKILTMISDRPYGNGWGKDNRYISFRDVCNLEDIGDVIDVLKKL